MGSENICGCNIKPCSVHEPTAFLAQREANYENTGILPMGQPRELSEDELEQAYWDFDAWCKGSAQYKGRQISERDAFKSVIRKMIGQEKLDTSGVFHEA